MSEDDRSRWDERYRTGDWSDIDEPATILTLAEAWLRPPGLALDAACGSGRNALHLARSGYTVVAVDISWEGLSRLERRARSEHLPIHIVHADLEYFRLTDECFDLILNSRFLLRRLFDVYRRALKPGGLLLFETLTVDEIEVLGGDIRRAFALERGELKAAFSDFQVLLYEEGVFEEPEGERGMARLIAKRPASRPSRRSHQRL